jgi:hypothetical protein
VPTDAAASPRIGGGTSAVVSGGVGASFGFDGAFESAVGVPGVGVGSGAVPAGESSCVRLVAALLRAAADE